MEKKKYNRIIIALICLLITALPLVGCSAVNEKIEDKTLRENTIKMITALMQDDKSTAHDLVVESPDADVFFTSYRDLTAFFDTINEYDFELLSAYRGVIFENGEWCTYSSAAYKLDTNTGDYVIEVASHSSYDGLYGFYLAPFKMTDYYRVGDITNMVGANWFQWTMLLSNILVLLITLIAFIECCVRRVRLKALWLVLMAIGFFTFGAAATLGSVSLLIEPAWLLSYSSYITYGGGTEEFRVLIPIGLIVYLCVRKKMIKRREKPQLVFPEGDAIYDLFRPEPEEAPSEDNTQENSH